ncbi:FtsX-like permease family protein [Arthrobacter yangruifuii]|uniref:FtsX-like permease family protein n=1 Tax=Arthrobacter yangruifuii TaxID=2606616 RepID=A0A5N6MDW5_9MICC|nr:FtsX-like permease family protein [Arthrobacter yangruifuii]KAD3455927.1 FtsX-like permease family protein [Arthrobacter yangruifuii]
MWSFARESIRHHRGGFAGVFVAVFLCAALITAMGVLIESGLRGGTAPERLQGAEVVVGAPQSLPVVEDMDAPLSERVLLPADLVARIAEVPGVEQAVGTVTVPLTDDAGRSLSASDWDSAVLAPYTLASGEEPRAARDVVVDGSFGAAPGDRLVLSYGGEPTEYTVSGIAEAETASGSPAVFLSSAGAAALWPHADTFATVGVIADGSVAPKELAADIEAGVDGVVTYTGDRRGDVENLGGSAARSTLLLLSGSLAGVALMTAVFVTAGTLSLSILARRREFAMLRAVGAGSGQTLGMIVREVLLVSGAAAVLGVAPGFGLAYFLGAQFTAGGVIPEDFALAYGPLPALAAVALSIAAAVGASLVSARGTVRMSPTTALREAVTEKSQLGRGRRLGGLVLLAAGIVAAMLPVAIPGTAGLAVAASSVLLLIIAAGMLGPWIVAGVLLLVGPLLGRSPSASLALAEANASAFPRRLAGGIIPLALAIALGSVQLFMPTTVETEADRQSRDGMVADYMVSAPGAGISADLADEVSGLPAVDTATPVAHSAVLADLRFLGTEDGLESYGIQGVDPENLDSTLDLGVSEGSLHRLSDPETVALSVNLARESGVGVGDRFAFHYGDGTGTSAVVVATYSRGLGFGDVTVANETLLQHTTAGLNDYLLVSAADGADGTEVAGQLAELGLSPVDRDAAGAAGAAERQAESWVNIVAMLVLLGYVGLSVVNSLVMATARRRPELMLLRSLGASDRQLRRMTGAESLLLVVAAVVLGTALAVPPLMGIAVSVSGLPLPTIQPWVYLAIAGAAAAIGFGSVALATHAALRAEKQG